MASKARKLARKNKPVATGKVKPLHKRKVKSDKMNAGGFYDGMPGVILDEYGNRKMIDFLVTPQGLYTTKIHAHPKLCKTAIQDAMSNPMIRGVVHSAVLDQVFANPTPWNWLLRMRLRLSLHLHHKRQQKKMKQAHEKMMKELKELEAKDKSVPMKENPTKGNTKPETSAEKMAPPPPPPLRVWKEGEKPRDKNKEYGKEETGKEEAGTNSQK